MNNPMKKIYLSFITVLLVALTAVSCQQDDELKGNVGYLRIEVGTNAYVDTRSVPEDYNPKQIALQILDSSNVTLDDGMHLLVLICSQHLFVCHSLPDVLF